MGSATDVGFTKQLAGRVWSVRKQPTVPIFRRDTCFVNWIPSRGVVAGEAAVGQRERRDFRSVDPRGRQDPTSSVILPMKNELVILTS